MVSNGWWVTIGLVDNGGNKTTRNYQLNSVTPVEAATDTGTIVTALGGVSDAVIVSQSTYERFVNDAVVYPASGVELENLAMLSFNIVDHPEKAWTTSIPAPKPAIFMATSGAAANIVDVGDAAVVAYAALFKTGGVAFVSDGEVADVLTGGKRIHRASSYG